MTFFSHNMKIFIFLFSMITAKLLQACFFSLKYVSVFLEKEQGMCKYTKAGNV